jgi:hypothetical protein
MPTGGAAVSWVDAQDVAAVAVQALTAGGHEGAAYTISGPAALGLAEVARLLGTALGRPLRALDPAPANAVAGLEPWLAAVIGDVYERVRLALSVLRGSQSRRVTFISLASASGLLVALARSPTPRPGGRAPGGRRTWAALATRNPGLASGGLAALGLGLSAVFPVTLHAAGSIPAPGPALAPVSTFGNTGFLTCPPTIGLLAEATSLRAALLPVGALCLLAALLTSDLAPELVGAELVEEALEL